MMLVGSPFLSSLVTDTKLCDKSAQPAKCRFSSSTVVGSTSKPNKRGRQIICAIQAADVAASTSAAYGLLLLGGGIYAFNKSGSKGSLYGGLTGAALMAATYYLLQAQESVAYGEALGFGSCFLFSIVFGIRLVATRKLIPAGALMALSGAASAVLLAAYVQQI